MLQVLSGYGNGSDTPPFAVIWQPEMAAKAGGAAAAETDA